MEQVHQASNDSTKCSELVEGHHDYKAALKRLKAMQESEEGLIPIWNHICVYKLYCKDPEVKEIYIGSTMTAIRQWGNIEACVLMTRTVDTIYISTCSLGSTEVGAIGPTR